MDWQAVSSIAAVCILFSGILSGLGTYFFTRGSHETNTQLRAQSAENLAAACLAKIELFASHLHQHEIEDAKSFAKLETLVNEARGATTAAETRLAQSLDDLGERFERMTDRIDRFLENRMAS